MKLLLVKNRLANTSNQPATLTPFNTPVPSTSNNFSIDTGILDTELHVTLSVPWLKARFWYHGQKMAKVDNPRLLVTSTPIHMGEWDEFCDGIKAIIQNLTQVFKHEEEMYETRYTNYLKYFGGSVHAGMRFISHYFWHHPIYFDWLTVMSNRNEIIWFIETVSELSTKYTLKSQNSNAIWLVHRKGYWTV